MRVYLRVQKIGQAKGFNISSLGRQADITLSAARRYWYGTSEGTAEGRPLRDINLDVVEKIARVMGISALGLLEEDEGGG